MTAMPPSSASRDRLADREADLTQALAAVRSRLAVAAQKAGRPTEDITLLPVTKFFPASDVAILARLGVRAVGESREQEAAAKIATLATMPAGSSAHLLSAPPPLKWHMIGRVQSNKVRALVHWAHTVHSVDSLKLVAALERATAKALAEGRREQPLRVYVQVSLDGDTSRGGVDCSADGAVERICAQIENASNLTLVGLMGVPPLDWAPDRAYELLDAEHRRVMESHPEARGLSAGMSGDFEIAVKHGSTCVRVGTALLGPRQLPSP